MIKLVLCEYAQWPYGRCIVGVNSELTYRQSMQLARILSKCIIVSHFFDVSRRELKDALDTLGWSISDNIVSYMMERKFQCNIVYKSGSVRTIRKLKVSENVDYYIYHRRDINSTGFRNKGIPKKNVDNSSLFEKRRKSKHKHSGRYRDSYYLEESIMNRNKDDYQYNKNIIDDTLDELRLSCRLINL